MFYCTQRLSLIVIFDREILVNKEIEQKEKLAEQARRAEVRSFAVIVAFNTVFE